MDADWSCVGMSEGELPTWSAIRNRALRHLDAARREAGDAGDWLRAIDSPLTPAQAQAASGARRLAVQVGNLIDQAKDALERGPSGEESPHA
jgi:hypothetical protein